VTVHVSCDARDLAWALRAVLPHAAANKVLPQLGAVRLELDAAGALLAVATDTHTIGCAMVPCDRDPGDTACALVAADDVREIIRRLRGQVSADLAFYADGEVVVGWTHRYPLVPGEYPAWRPALGELLRYPARTLQREHGILPDYLARFRDAALPGGQGALTVMPVHDDTRPAHGAVVVIGDRFAGAVMVARLYYSDYDPAAQLAQWRARLPLAKGM
jgi:hypothetical protein